MAGTKEMTAIRWNHWGWTRHKVHPQSFHLVTYILIVPPFALPNLLCCCTKTNVFYLTSILKGLRPETLTVSLPTDAVWLAESHQNVLFFYGVSLHSTTSLSLYKVIQSFRILPLNFCSPSTAIMLTQLNKYPVPHTISKFSLISKPSTSSCSIP